jgi:hypothetical protein
MKYNFTINELIEYVKESKSAAEVLRKLEWPQNGSLQMRMKSVIEANNIHISHWTGQLWSKGQRLKEWKEYTRGRTVKPHLIKLRGHKCESCKLEMWLKKKIPLEVHHKDRNKKNNTPENLQLICLNCHFQTEHFRNRKFNMVN